MTVILKNLAVCVLLSLGSACAARANSADSVHLRFEVKSEYLNSDPDRFDVDKIRETLLDQMHEILRDGDYSYWNFQRRDPTVSFAFVLRAKQVGRVRPSGTKFKVELLAMVGGPPGDVLARKPWIEPGDDLPDDTREVEDGIYSALSDIFDDSEQELLNWLRQHVPLTKRSQWINQTGVAVNPDEMEVMLNLPESRYSKLKNSLFNVVAIPDNGGLKEYKLTAVGLQFVQEPAASSDPVSGGLAAVVRARHWRGDCDLLPNLEKAVLTAMLMWKTQAVYWQSYVPPGLPLPKMRCQ